MKSWLKDGASVFLENFFAAIASSILLKKSQYSSRPIRRKGKQPGRLLKNTCSVTVPARKSKMKVLSIVGNRPEIYGDGKASQKIVEIMENYRA